MKIITGFFLVLLFWSTVIYFGCSQGKKTNVYEAAKSEQRKQDLAEKSVQVATFSDTIENSEKIHRQIFSNKIENCDSAVRAWKVFAARITITNDSLHTKLFLALYKLEKVKYYVSIVNAKPSQIKYLKGWVIRAVQ